jgi:tripartite-type tricarboxylate transporter receptor subunit TctC
MILGEFSMLSSMRAVVAGLSALCFVLAASPHAWAQASYPSKPIRMIVPFPPGGSTDFLARLTAQKLSESLGQQVLVENRTGASGIIGADLVAKAPVDGYTLLMASPAEIAVNHYLYAKVPYNPERDFAPITLVGITPLVIAAHPSVPAKNIRELVALAKSMPGQLSFASAGTGSTQHLTGEMLMAAAGIRLIHVPYKGAGQSIPDVIGGQLPLGVYGLLTIFQQAKAGKLKILAVTTPKRSPVAPDYPTLAESGFPGFDTSLWNGLLAPAATPKDIIGKLHAEIVRILKLPDVAERIASQGAIVVGNTPAEFAAFIAAESAKYSKIIKQAGVKLE